MSVKQVMDGRIVAVIRHSKVDNIISIIEKLSEGGIHTIEVTAETKDFRSILEKAVNHFEGTKTMIGAGTVNTVRAAKEALEAGADFIVSPALNEEVVKFVKGKNGVMVPGVMTPTEIMNAYHLGADMVKIFPAGVMGASYIKSIQVPLPEMPIMVTGGINEKNMKDFFEAGADVVGLGSELVDAKNITEKTLQEIKEKAEKVMKTIK
ncbi:bifunctional 4-hydroxy-2-oxoglutarate aldolase/2-dehydro-3-deoxy-phosphogluconate aldolase [Salimicrobium album]|uniref:2-dehydro-3-deoxyphosphogluconate aldolase / (4S)-4-hydroxy-2-oxoglutarate aldolase n=1 Tax=Salimicrobium album TaxID=50717 RepID=A0A1H3FRE6_9BACI|nr:bifunctional 4-hydroxy-2-oxoglutarate aldolase/2-dehydro-3-deoxy-phosphogluconate aldolase [Salimicrobium album]SDX93576.1 2-dehydro-3-deoxyphosphogluconate aldolase / (4S)-4-hydroxy-2-oxoglutarate aldolase [Salimicrobium album]